MGFSVINEAIFSAICNVYLPNHFALSWANKGKEFYRDIETIGYLNDDAHFVCANVDDRLIHNDKTRFRLFIKIPSLSKNTFEYEWIDMPDFSVFSPQNTKNADSHRKYPLYPEKLAQIYLKRQRERVMASSAAEERSAFERRVRI